MRACVFALTCGKLYCTIRMLISQNVAHITV